MSSPDEMLDVCSVVEWLQKDSIAPASKLVNNDNHAWYRDECYNRWVCGPSIVSQCTGFLKDEMENALADDEPFDIDPKVWTPILQYNFEEDSRALFCSADKKEILALAHQERHVIFPASWLLAAPVQNHQVFHEFLDRLHDRAYRGETHITS